MGPGGVPGKRKRGDRTYSQDSGDGSRPSPHHPGNLRLAHHGYAGPPQYGYSYNRPVNSPRGGRGRGRGMRGNYGSARSPMNSPSTPHSHQSFRPLSSGSPSTAPERAEQPAQPAQPRQAAEMKPPAPRPTASTQTPPPPTQIPYYLYDYVTADARDKWKESGRQNVIDAGIKASEDRDFLRLSTLYQETARAGLDGHLHPEEAGFVIKAILDAKISGAPVEDDALPFDPASLFLDTISMLPFEDTKNARFKPLLFSTQIPSTMMREVLDVEVLVQVGLVRSTFERKVIRNQTNILYRQSNYNLLREETEGYSKLITELFTTSSNEPPSAEVVTQTFERVKALIGTFDLDVGRALDITLDVFASILVKHYRFVVKYLRVSSWWPQLATAGRRSSDDAGMQVLPKWAVPGAHGSRPLNEEEKQALSALRDQRDTAFWDRVREIGLMAFFELGGRQPESEASNAAIDDNGDNLLPVREWMEQTGTLPPCGNKVAAQILGFKLQFYSSTVRESTDTMPHNLLALAALLIKIGFISLADLYPHLFPEDDAMVTVKEEKEKEKVEQDRLRRPGGGTANALMKAGALPDDTLPAASMSRTKEAEAAKVTANPETKDGKPVDAKTVGEGSMEGAEPVDQKIQLLKSLLCIGAIPDALYILGRFPWLPDLIPDLPEYIHRLLHYSLHKVYDPLQPLRDHHAVREPHEMVDPDQSGVAKGSVRLIDQPPRRVLRWAQLDKSDPCEETEYRFYWDDWVDNVPVCQTIDDVFQLCRTLLSFSGLKIGWDPSLLAKLTRIGIHSLDIDGSESNRLRWINLAKRLLVPALSMTRHNSGIVGEVWMLLKHFPITVRYNIYAEWFTGQTSRLPDLKSAFELARAETKDVLKRISKKNTKQMARALAKVATSSPGIVFHVALNQIESYDNLSEVIVDCARYFTDLGYDVLTWSLMNALGARGRDRVQADGMLTSKWLSALSSFSGTVFKRYSIMNPTPILQYVADQLRKGNFTDLVVLEQITFSMGGIVSDATFNDAQVICMAGGPVLRTQTMLQLLDRRNEPGIQTSSKRLMRALVGPNLVGQLLVSMAQVRQTCIYTIPEEDSFLKLLGNVFDELQRILTQYLDLLRTNLSIKEFNASVPSLESLIKDFGIEPSVAFWISRSSIASEMAEHDKNALVERSQTLQSETPNPEKAASIHDVDMIEKSEPGEQAEAGDGRPAEDVATRVNGSEDVEMKTSSSSQAKSSGTPPKSPRLQSSDPKYPWHPILKATVDAVRPVLPEDTWKHISETFYFSFWQMSLSDILVPTAAYEVELNRQSRKIEEVMKDRSDISAAGLRAKEQNKKSIDDLLVRLRAELKEHVSIYSHTRVQLQKQKDFWFADATQRWDAISVALLEHCFFPRIALSAVDALYVFRMLILLHSSGAKNFRTIKVLDAIFNAKRLTAIIFQFTSKEAEYFGRFLNEILKFLGNWHSSKETYEKEAYGKKKDLRGFLWKKEVPMEYEDFRKLLQKWHMALNVAFKNCFSGGEYMHIRNAIVVLKSIATVFPAINWMGQAQVASVMEITKSDSREDVKLAAMSLLGNLKRREKEWVLPQAFSLNQGRANGANNSKPTSKPGTPQPQSTGEKKPLNAKALEFQPRITASADGPPKIATPTSAKADVEDGEIKDPNSAKATSFNNPFAEKKNPFADQGETKALVADLSRPSVPAARTDGAVLQQATTKTAALTKPTSPRPSREPEKKELAEQPPLQSQPPRPNAGRNVSDSFVNGRSTHALPSRPEALPNSVRLADARIAEKPYDRSQREHREGHFHDTRRGDWNTGYNRDQQLSDRHGPSYRGYERPPERGPSERERQDASWTDKMISRNAVVDDRYGAPPPDMRSTYRDDLRLDRSGRDDASMQRYGEKSMQPPRGGVSHTDRSTPAHSSVDGDRGHGSLHPDRPGEAARHDGSVNPSSQRSSRAPSPNRSRPDHHARDDRPTSDSRRTYEDVGPSRSRYDDTRPPAGPRNGPGGLSQNPHASRGPPTGPHSDFGSSRSSRDPNTYPHQESQYGRLNNDAHFPSGPRMPNGTTGPARGPRGVPAIQSQVNMPAQTTSIPQTNHPNKMAPSGPSNRSARDTSFPGRQPPSSSAPQSPASHTADTVGVHPERLKAMQGAKDDSTLDAGRTAPPPQVASSVGSGLRAPPPQPAAATTPANRGPATGPSAGAPRERPDKRFTGLNNVLQQGNAPDRTGPGANLRPRLPRTGNGPSPIATGPPRQDILKEPPYASRSEAPGPSPSNLPPARADLVAPKRAASGPYPSSAVQDDERGPASQRDRDSRPPYRHGEHSQSPLRRPPPGPLSAPGPPGPGYARDDSRPMMRTRASAAADETRDHRAPRTFSGPPDGGRRLRDRDDGPGLAKDRERRDMPYERKDGPGAWGGDRHGRDRDRRDEYEMMGPGRKRSRVEESYELGKRSRHGP